MTYNSEATAANLNQVSILKFSSQHQSVQYNLIQYNTKVIAFSSRTDKLLIK